MSSSLLDVTNDTSLSLLIRKRAILPSPAPTDRPLADLVYVTGSLFEPQEHCRFGKLLICTFCLLLLVPLRFR